ncbi:hypothetical protein PSHT_13248 [Puccinia striiformis]|uniref:Uncharacterized protein n=1 Tax=Puccinia striiformis TaxID=27350 RepID=A0A2S4US67_9BASI|nr:hypothetical protein PSHT_13248 [Puccinia striiformis]
MTLFEGFVALPCWSRRGRGLRLEAFAPLKNPPFLLCPPPHTSHQITYRPHSLCRVDSTPSNSYLFVLLTWHCPINLLCDSNSCVPSVLVLTPIKRAIEAERCSGRSKMQLLMIVAALLASLCFLHRLSTTNTCRVDLPKPNITVMDPKDPDTALPRSSSARLLTDNPMMTTSYNPFIRPQDRPKHSMRVDRNSVHKAGSFWDFGGQARPYTSDFQSS